MCALVLQLWYDAATEAVVRSLKCCALVELGTQLHAWWVAGGWLAGGCVSGCELGSRSGSGLLVW